MPVVAAGDDDLPDMHAFVASDCGRGGGVEVAGVEAGVLDGVVEGVDVLVAAGGDRHCPPGRGERKPVVGDAGQVLVERAGGDPPMALVDADGVGVAGAQLQRCGGFPGVAEAVDAGQPWVRPVAATSANSPPRPTACNWSGVTDQDHAPIEMVGEAGEVVQGAGPQHPGLIDHEGGAGGKLGTSSLHHLTRLADHLDWRARPGR